MSGLTFFSKIESIHNTKIACEIFVSSRAQQPRITVSRKEGVRIIIPERVRNKERVVQDILRLRINWIEKQWQRMQLKKKEHLEVPDFIEVAEGVIGKSQFRDYAKQKITERVIELADTMHLRFNKITVRSQKHLWGSCSIRKNLSFNWRLILLPPELMDYVILHEFTHLHHMNHGKDFWRALENICPGSKGLNKRLRQYEY